MKTAPQFDAREEGLDLVEGDEETPCVEGLLGVDEQEILQTARRRRQGFWTGPVQFEVENIQLALA